MTESGLIRHENGNPIFSGTFLAKVKSGKKLQVTVTPVGSKKALKLNGIPAATAPDLTGQWTASVTLSGSKANETYTFAPSVTLANVFDLAGQGPAGTLTGTLLVTSRGVLNASMTNTVLRSLAGKTTRATKLTLKGADGLGNKIAIKAVKQ